MGVSATAAFVGVATVLGWWHQPCDVIAVNFGYAVWAAVGLLAAALVGHHPPAPTHSGSVHVGALIGALARSAGLWCRGGFGCNRVCAT